LKQELQKAKSAKPVLAVTEVRSSSAEDVRRQMLDGLAQERVGDFTAALGLYDKVISARPAYAEALKARGRCLLQMGKFDEAAAVFRRVATANPDDGASRVFLGVTHCLAGKFNQAIEVLNPLVVDDPSNALAQNAIGAAWMGLGDTRAAKVALEKAVSLDPELSDARFNLAQVLVAGGPNDTNKARE
jgi:Flp pilus assembly protein TadD